MGNYLGPSTVEAIRISGLSHNDGAISCGDWDLDVWDDTPMPLRQANVRGGADHLYHRDYGPLGIQVIQTGNKKAPLLVICYVTRSATQYIESNRVVASQECEGSDQWGLLCGGLRAGLWWYKSHRRNAGSLSIWLDEMIRMMQEDLANVDRIAGSDLRPLFVRPGSGQLSLF